MKRTVALVLVILLGIVVLAVAGCGGGDTEQAQEYLKKADAAYMAMQTDMDALAKTLTDVLGGALSGNYGAVTLETLNTADAAINKALAEIPNLSAMYQKVDGLKGVEDYKAYADAMVKTLEIQTQALKQGKEMITALLPIAADPAAIAAWFQANSSMLNQAQELNSQATKAYDDAQQIKQDKNLTW